MLCCWIRLTLYTHVISQKAIQESEKEWSQNKKLVDLSKKDVRHSIPKGFPYFSVNFGLQDGFAHVIEDEQSFPWYFGKVRYDISLIQQMHSAFVWHKREHVLYFYLTVKEVAMQRDKLIYNESLLSIQEMITFIYTYVYQYLAQQ